MAIIYNPNKKIFNLHTAHTTYQMQVDPLGYLLHLYYGDKTNSPMDYVLTYADRGFSGNPYAAGMDRTYSLDALPQEYPSIGTGDYRNIALNIKNEKGVESADLLLKVMRSEAANTSYRDFRLSGQTKRKHRHWKLSLQTKTHRLKFICCMVFWKKTMSLQGASRLKIREPGRLRSKRQRQPVWILYREILMSCGFMESMPWSAIWSVRRWGMEPLRLAAAGERQAISIIRQ